MAKTTAPKRVKLNATQQFAVQLGRWAIQNNVDILDAAELVALAGKAHHAGENYCNEGDRYGGKYEKAHDRAHDAFEEKATAIGFEVQWPGLWPTLKKDGQDIYLPSDK